MMCMVRTDYQNQLNEENLTHLLWAKVDVPTIEVFHVNHRGKMVTLCYNGEIRNKMQQPQEKAYIKREIK